MREKINFEETVSFLLAKVTTAFRSAFERHMSLIGLHGGMIFVLLELWKEDGLRQIDLARRLDVTAPTVSNMLNGLIEIGLVVRTRKKDRDARAVRIYLTTRGNEMREQIEEQWLELEAECVSSITEIDRLVLLEILKKLRRTYTDQKQSEEDDE